MFSGIIWCGLSVAATLATYLRIRNPQSGRNAWRASILGVQLFAVSGLDFIPVIALMIVGQNHIWESSLRRSNRRLEHPGYFLAKCLDLGAQSRHRYGRLHHRNARNSCVRSRNRVSLGDLRDSGGCVNWLSPWVISMGSLYFWILHGGLGDFTLIPEKTTALIPAILIAGILGLAMASPFIIDILQLGGKSQSTGALPTELYIRPFSFSNSLESQYT